LTVLAERVTANETRDLLAQLPKALKTNIAMAPQPASFAPREFVERVSNRLPSAGATGTTDVRAVFSVLHDAVSAGEMRDIAEQLGDDYADLWGRPLPASGTAKHTGRAGSAPLATVRGGAHAAGNAALMVGGVVLGLAGAAVGQVTELGRRMSSTTARTLRRAGAIGARKAEAAADALEEAADGIGDSAERAAERLEASTMR
jgi:uncharacterized protein (DUF2267 family)